MTSDTKIAPSTISTPIAEAFVTALKTASPCPNRFRVLARDLVYYGAHGIVQYYVNQGTNLLVRA